MSKKICLYDLEQLALISIESKGYIYYNQTGGTACFQEQEEGILVFVED